MTEAEWLASTDAKRLTAYIFYNLSPRKRTLLFCGCVRRIWDLISDERCRTAIELAEQHADGLVQDEELDAAYYAAAEGAIAMDKFARKNNYNTPLICAMTDAGTAACKAIDGHQECVDDASCAAAYFAVDRPLIGLRIDHPADWHEAKHKESQQQIRLMHCIFGNPFRPVTFDPAWRTATVTSLAQAIYDERAFDRLPILADALEDAGCTNADVLGHCRGGGEHVRACWVLDFVLGKM